MKETPKVCFSEAEEDLVLVLKALRVSGQPQLFPALQHLESSFPLRQEGAKEVKGMLGSRSLISIWGQMPTSHCALRVFIPAASVLPNKSVFQSPEPRDMLLYTDSLLQQ